jgi:glutamate--cysteine ligase
MNKLDVAACRELIKKELFTPSPGKSQNAENALGSIGVELESFSNTVNSNGVFPAPLVGRNSLANALIELSENCSIEKKSQHQQPLSAADSIVDKIIYPNSDYIRFEPGGQIEIITAPCSDMRTLQINLESMQEKLNGVSHNTDIQFIQYGTHPWFAVEEIGLLLNFPRYRALAEYFDSIGPYGKKMMLQTCSTHINLDLGSNEVVQVKRIVLANLLVPFATALFANSSVIEGKDSGHKSFRSFLWQQLDPLRTGIMPLGDIALDWDKEKLVDAYLNLALKAPIIYIEDIPDIVFPTSHTFEYWLSNPIHGISPDISHLRNHLSLLFPSVRLKGHIEIRTLDAPPQEWQMLPILFYTGLLYSEKYLDKAIELLLPVATEIKELHVQSTMGFKSDLIFSLSQQLLEFSIQGYSGLEDSLKNGVSESQMVEYSEKFTQKRKSFADEMSNSFLRPSH